jgi:hypothetical protein
MGKRCFKTARTSSKVIRGLDISELTFPLENPRQAIGIKPHRFTATVIIAVARGQEARARRHRTGAGDKFRNPETGAMVKFLFSLFCRGPGHLASPLMAPVTTVPFDTY